MFNSPLRYPGGKNKLAPFIAQICKDNNISGHYIEPYSGGASVALFLLLEGYVEKITINDKDRSIYAFWHSVLNKTNELCELIQETEITINEWYKQKEIQKDKDKVSLLELGFSTLFLNRTNRSGIINAGVMGGIKQKGKYLIDCRFNKEEIIRRIRKIAKKKKFIKLYKKDAISLIEKTLKNNDKTKELTNTIFYFDPPYYLKGNTLYMNHYSPKDHKNVSEAIKRINNIHWIVSYDNTHSIKNLYSNCKSLEYSFKHTAYKAREGKEILFFSDQLQTPNISHYNPVNYKYSKKKITYKKEKIA